MKNTKNILWALPLFSVLLFTACEKDDPEVPNEGELITTLVYILSPDSGGGGASFTFRDLDGDGGNPPEISTYGSLSPNRPYTGIINILDESQTPPDGIHDEILAEADEHQLFFQPSIGLNAAVSYNDGDINGNPIGIETSFTTGAASTGTMTVTLRHMLNKSATGVADGDITNAGGETDIEVTFDVTVQ